jgi:hypothetical protein
LLAPACSASTGTGAPVDGASATGAAAVHCASMLPSYPYHLSTAEARPTPQVGFLLHHGTALWNSPPAQIKSRHGPRAYEHS